VRDAGGPAFALKRAIDEGVVAGPRIYPSGAFISQTAGHGDFRLRHEVPRACGTLSHGEVMGATAIADGVDQVLRAAREQLLLGASQLKVMAGGGIASPYDPIDVTQYTGAELRAAVERPTTGDLCDGACLHPAVDHPGGPGRGALHRARPPGR